MNEPSEQNQDIQPKRLPKCPLCANADAASSIPDLIVNLVPLSIAPPGSATLIVNGSSSISTPTWYTIPVTATSPGITQTIGVNLLVGGERMYLPIIRK